MIQYSSLFQQQSYIDAWESHIEALSGSAPTWDYVILTASNEDQAISYRNQIDYRLKLRKLPEKTVYAVIPDRDNKRVGSGGATLGAIRYVRGRESSFEDKRILVIHSGGDSKRVAQYSACGKLFSPVPRMLPDGRRSTLFDEFIVGMSGAAARISGGMLVCSGDVLMLFNPLQVDFFGQGAAALSIKECMETGMEHGVYLCGRNGNVARFLHKQTAEALTSSGAVDERGNIDIDTGAVILDADILVRLYSLIDTDEKYDSLVNERTRLSFYADFLYPLAEASTLEQFYMEKPEGDFTPELHAARTLVWNALHGCTMKLIRLSPASFIHFGTSSELRSLMADEVDKYCYLGWSRRVNCNRECADFAANNSYIAPGAQIGKGAYIEDSYIYPGTVVGENCIVSCVTLEGQRVPDNAVLHGLKLADGRFVARMFGVHDNPKEARLFGRVTDGPLWTACVYPVRDDIRNAVDAALAAYAAGFPADKDNISLFESFRQADTAAILDWQQKLDDKVKVESLLEAIDRREVMTNAIGVFAGRISPRAEGMLRSTAEALDENELEAFGRKMRIYHALFMLTGSEEYSSQCFAALRSAMLNAAFAEFAYDGKYRTVKEEVTVRLPVRINWGGGWSDTPPYCLENGGAVLNAAVSLDGGLPVEAVVKRAECGKIILTSGDNGSYREFDAIDELQATDNPYDPFALHKAALIACGIIPYKEKISVREITDRLGCGVYLSTQVAGIPRGSGLGTSSILAGACVKAIMEFVGRTLSEDETYNCVMCMEQIMSTGGGWQDQVGGMTPGVKLVTTKPGLRQHYTCTPVVMSEKTLNELNDRLALIYTGQRRLARNLLRDIVGRYIASEPDAVESIFELQRVAALMCFELERGNVDGFAKLLNRHWELSRRLDAGSTNTCIDQLFMTVDDLIDGKMICGAGGGGFLQVILKKGVTFDMLQARLYDVFQDSGARAWQCEIV